jgi:hypothetical protein
MKAAICISGHLRHFKKLKDNFFSFKKVLQKFLDVDVFVCTWDKQNTLNSWSHAHNISNADTAKNIININEVKDHYSTDYVELLDYDFYSSDYSPISYKDLTDRPYSWDSRGVGGDVVNSSKMFFLIYEANKLKKKQEFFKKNRYDLVFRVRPDYEFINHEQFFEDFFKNENNITKEAIYVSKPYGCSPIDDQFAFGSSKIMDKYSSCILKQSLFFNSKIWGDPETILINSLSFMHEINLIQIPRIGCLGSDITNIKR